jgi:cell division septum initiation protein DivIVA
MSDLQSNIKRVNDKLQKLLRQYTQLQKDNERQSRLIKDLQETKEKQASMITTLQQQTAVLKASAGQMEGADKKAFEKHINQYIKEIDKCIGLLSA